MAHCNDEDLLAFLDGELGEGEFLLVGEHLDACWSCRSRMAALEADIQRLAQASEQSIFPGPTWLVEARDKLRSRLGVWEADRVRADGSLFMRAKLSLSSRRGLRWRWAFSAAAAFVLFWLMAPDSKSQAAELLERSARLERSLLDRVRAEHGTWEIEHRRESQIVWRRKLDLWRDRNGRRSARKLYDEQNRLVAAEWSDAGNRTLCVDGHCGQGTPQTRPFERSEDAWLFDFSAEQVRDWTRGMARANVRRAADAWYVDFSADATTSSSGPALVRASLTLEARDLRVVASSFTVNSGGSEWELGLRQTALETYETQDPPKGAFEPELLFSPPVSSAPNTPAPPIRAKNDLQKGPWAPVRIQAALEIQILEALAQANLTLGDDAALTRDADGVPHLSAHVRSDAERSHVLEAIRTFIDSKRMTTDVNVSAAAGSIADRVVKDENTAVVGHGWRARTHARAAAEIATRFRADDLNELPEEDRQKWLTLILRHTMATRHEIAALKLALGRSVEPSETYTSDINSLNLAAHLKHLATATSAIHSQLSAAFRADSAGTLANRNELIRLLDSAESCAAAIQSAMAP